MSRRPKTTIQLGDEIPSSRNAARVKQVQQERVAAAQREAAKKPRKVYVNELVMRKLEDRQREVEEKRKTLDVLNSYDPWGKPGCGAPSTDSKRHKLVLDDNHNQNNVKKELGQALFPDGGYKSYRDRVRRQPGPGGAADPADQEIFFQPNHMGAAQMHVDRRMRFMPPREEADKYMGELNQLKDYRERLRQDERRVQQDAEAQMLKYNPYGKPGAGAPNRTQSGRPKIGFTSESLLGPGKTNSNHQPLTARDSFVRSVEHPDEFDPWNKGSGNPFREENGYLKRRPNNAKELLGVKPVRLKPIDGGGSVDIVSAVSPGNGKPSSGSSGRRQQSRQASGRSPQQRAGVSAGSWSTPITQSRTSSAVTGVSSLLTGNKAVVPEPMKFRVNDKSIVRNPITGDVNRQNHAEMLRVKRLEESRASMEKAQQYSHDLEQQIETHRKLVAGRS